MRLQRRMLSILAVAGCLTFGRVPSANAIEITLDYTLDEQNWNWFGGTPAGLARRASLDAAAAFLSEIITNDDWAALPSLDESFGLTDIFQSSINGLDGQPIAGVAESDGTGFAYTIPTTNRASVEANEYVVYVAALAFDTGTSAHAKAGWDSNDRRNPAGIAGTEFNTWGGRVYFDLSSSWYSGQNPGINPTDDYGFQDPDKTPSSDTPDDDWDFSTSSFTWKGFDLESVDASADGLIDLYGTGLHELLHALGATTSNIGSYVGVDSQGDFVGENLVATYGGPVPGDGGHFAENLQSNVWNSDGIVSEATLDPNSLRGRRKYLTEIDAALLRDLGYDVAFEFPSAALPGDFNGDRVVDAADYTLWRDNEGMPAGTLVNDIDGGVIGPAQYDTWVANFRSTDPMAVATPEPSSSMLLLGALFARRRGQWSGIRESGREP